MEELNQVSELLNTKTIEGDGGGRSRGDVEGGNLLKSDPSIVMLRPPRPSGRSLAPSRTSPNRLSQSATPSLTLMARVLQESSTSICCYSHFTRGLTVASLTPQ